MTPLKTRVLFSVVALVAAIPALAVEPTDAMLSAEREWAENGVIADQIEVEVAADDTEVKLDDVEIITDEIEVATDDTETTLDDVEVIVDDVEVAVTIEDATQGPVLVSTQVTDLDVPEEEKPIDLAKIAESDPSLSIRAYDVGEPETMVMLSDVLFEFGEATLAPEAIDVLENLAPKLASANGLEIKGHTDAIGDEGTNTALGLRRAEAVRQWLIENGTMEAELVNARGIGEADPIAANLNEDGSDNPAGRALNRRVEFSIPESVEVSALE